MRELDIREASAVSGGEVGATGSGDDVSYTGVYPECKLVGAVAAAAVIIAGEAVDAATRTRLGSIGVELSGAADAAKSAAEFQCIRNYGEPHAELPPMAQNGQDFLLKIKHFGV